MPRPQFRLAAAVFLLIGLSASAAEPGADGSWFAAQADELVGLYKHLHSNPELSYQEVKTAGRIADELSKAGAEVTTGVGKLGVVGVLKNGKGPTVLVRTDLDALPVVEETGVSYASKAKGDRLRRKERRRNARVRPRRPHDLPDRHRPLAGRAQGTLVRDGRLHRAAGRGDDLGRQGDAQGRPLHTVSEA